MAIQPSVDQLAREHKWLRGVARTLVHDLDDAEDLVQEAWVAAWRSPPPGDRPLRAWLRGVVRNLARMKARSERRRQDRERVSEEARRPDPERPAADPIDAERLLHLLRHEIEEPFRSTLLLRFGEGLSATEIATREGIPAGTVRWRTKRGLDLLRATLDARSAGDRSAWLSGLLPLADLPSRGVAAPGATGAAATGSVATAWKGVMAMSTAKTMAAVGAVAVAATTGVWLWTSSVNPAPDEVRERPAPSRQPLSTRGRALAGDRHPAASVTTPALERAAGAIGGDRTRSKAEIIEAGERAWQAEPVDSAWASRMESRLRERLARSGHELPAGGVECRTQCCRLTIDREQFEQAQRELLSSVGIGDFGLAEVRRPAREGPLGHQASLCFDRTDGQIGERMPDRGAEREALLRAASPALSRCAADAEQPFSFAMTMVLDESGAVADLKSSADFSGTAPARCVEQAILSSASFAPGPGTARIPIELYLDPGDPDRRTR
jgi:RNA polymerase sigma-70 factor (ECF subfamily)